MAAAVSTSLACQNRQVWSGSYHVGSWHIKKQYPLGNLPSYGKIIIFDGYIIYEWGFSIALVY
jgi:hypothetical protein